MSFLAAGAAVFVLCLTVQYLGYDKLLARGLRSAAVGERRLALKRWVGFAAAWQVLVLAGILLYLFVARGSGGMAWIAPPVAALVGTALPLQLVVMRLLRAATRE